MDSRGSWPLIYKLKKQPAKEEEEDPEEERRKEEKKKKGKKKEREEGRTGYNVRRRRLPRSTS